MSEPAPVSTPAPDITRLNWPFIVVATFLHLGALYALIGHWSWAGIAVAGIGQIVFGWIGVSMGYHRLLTHASFKAKPWLERILATLAALSVQGGPIHWVATHLGHHVDPDGPKDPHSPHVPMERLAGMTLSQRFRIRFRAFWHAHLGWMIRGGQRLQAFRAVERLKASRYYRFLETGQILLQIPLGVVLFLLGGWTFVLYGIFVRIAFSWHATFCVNSVCHLWGSRRYETSDDSRNNHFVAWITGGEGHHNDHHGEPRSARYGRRFWDIDPIWWMICLFEKLGLVTDVVRPSRGA